MEELERKISQEKYHDGFSQSKGPSLLDIMTDWYFKPRFFERSGKLYEALGVKLVKKACVRLGKLLCEDKVDWPNNYFIWDHSKEGLKKFDYYTRLNESIHFLPALTFTCKTLIYLSQKDIGTAAFVTGLNLISGVGPLMLQRYNRARLYNLIDKMKEREKLKDQGTKVLEDLMS